MDTSASAAEGGAAEASGDPGAGPDSDGSEVLIEGVYDA